MSFLDVYSCQVTPQIQRRDSPENYKCLLQRQRARAKSRKKKQQLKTVNGHDQPSSHG